MNVLGHLISENMRDVTVQPGEGSSEEGGIIHVYKYLMGGCKEDRARLFAGAQ